MELESSGSRFLDLPAELRLHIYTFVFQRVSCGLVTNVEDEIFRERLCDEKGSSSGASHCTALLRTCRQIRKQAEPVLFESGGFDIAFLSWPYQPPSGHKALGTIGSCQLLKRVKHLNVLAIYVSDPSDVAASAQSVRALVQIVNTSRVKIEELQLKFYDLSGNAGDPIVEALMSLDCETPVMVKSELKANMGWGYAAANGIAVSEDLYSRFLNKVGRQ